jgi:NDP-sugar pyrophosphorylase family protein
VTEAGALASTPVAILAGGLGTRLQPAIGERQKTVAEVAGRPFLARLLDQVARFGFRDVVLCVGFGAEQVERALGAAHGALRLRYSREPEPLGTAGALRLALPLLAGDAAMVMNGDSFCDADLAVAWESHRRRQALATLVLVEVDDAARYGRVELGPNDEIRCFAEKQLEGGPGWINAGIYLLARPRIEAIPDRHPLSLECDVFPSWVGKRLFGHRSRARFIDIGTPQSYADASRLFAADDRGSQP